MSQSITTNKYEYVCMCACVCVCVPFFPPFSQMAICYSHLAFYLFI